MSDSILLIHGGLYEEMTAQRFWADTGILGVLAGGGVRVFAPDRMQHPRSWHEEAAYLSDRLPPATRWHIVGGSNGCSVAIRMALDLALPIASLVLCWPVTAGDPVLDAELRRNLLDRGVTDGVISTLLEGEILRGVSDRELGQLHAPTLLIPPDPPDPVHRHTTVYRLHRLCPKAQVSRPYPLPLVPPFADRLQAFCSTVLSFIENQGESGVALTP